MAKMRQVTPPRLQQLKERFGDDRQKLNQEAMKLYQTEKINPLGGCLPIVIQIPVFIALYWVLLGAVEMRDAPWMLWITDLSTADPYYAAGDHGRPDADQTKLNPTPPDPIQAKVMMAMPLHVRHHVLLVPAGLVLYWVREQRPLDRSAVADRRMIEGAPRRPDRIAAIATAPGRGGIGVVPRFRA